MHTCRKNTKVIRHVCHCVYVCELLHSSSSCSMCLDDLSAMYTQPVKGGYHHCSAVLAVQCLQYRIKATKFVWLSHKI